MPITWKNPTGTNPTFAAPGMVLNSAIKTAQAGLDAPRIERAAAMDLMLNQSKLDRAPTELEAVKAQLRGQQIENQYAGQNAQSILDFRKANTANAMSATNKRQEEKDIGAFMNSPEFFLPDPNRKGYLMFDADEAGAQALGQGFSPAGIVAARESIMGGTGATSRAAVAAEERKHENALELARGKRNLAGGGYDISGVEADTIGMDTDAKAQADLQNNLAEYIKKGLPRAEAYEAIRGSLNFRGAYNSRRGLPALDNALQKYKSTK